MGKNKQMITMGKHADIPRHPDAVSGVDVKKLCGPLEPCFVDGEEVWGMYGAVLCAHASEIEINGTSYCRCGVTGETVDGYAFQWQYNIIVSDNDNT